jgi:hypothetical protein
VAAACALTPAGESEPPDLHVPSGDARPGLAEAFPRRGWRRGSTGSDSTATPAPGMVNRQFATHAPNRLKVAESRGRRHERTFDNCRAAPSGCYVGSGGARHRLTHRRFSRGPAGRSAEELRDGRMPCIVEVRWSG